MSTFLSQLEKMEFMYNLTNGICPHTESLSVYNEAFERMRYSIIECYDNSQGSEDYWLVDELFDYFMITVLDLNDTKSVFKRLAVFNTDDEAGENSCVLEFNDNIYRIVCNYVSYRGFDFDSLSIEIVEPISHIIDTYEKIHETNKIDNSTFLAILFELRDAYSTIDKAFDITDVKVGDFEKLCEKIHGLFFYQRNQPTTKLKLIEADVVNEEYYIVFMFNGLFYKFNFYFNSLRDFIFDDSYIKQVYSKTITTTIYE